MARLRCPLVSNMPGRMSRDVILYVATSSSASGHGAAGTEHHVTAFAIDPASGALTPHGAPIRLPTRPIHMTADIPSTNILVAFNNPSALRVYRVNEDFTPGEEVKPPRPIDAGIYAHQVRVTPDNRLVILVTRGNEVTPTKAEDPGALKVFDYKDGVLDNEVSIAPNGGKEFGPRHLDFHPTKPWMYVSIETGGALRHRCRSGSVVIQLRRRQQPGGGDDRGTEIAKLADGEIKSQRASIRHRPLFDSTYQRRHQCGQRRGPASSTQHRR